MQIIAAIVFGTIITLLLVAVACLAIDSENFVELDE